MKQPTTPDEWNEFKRASAKQNLVNGITGIFVGNNAEYGFWHLTCVDRPGDGSVIITMHTDSGHSFSVTVRDIE